MADRWMDERDRQWRDRDWSRSEQQYGRGRDDWRGDEDRSFESFENGGERNQDYSRGSRVTSGGGAYGAGGSYGGGESYGRGSTGGSRFAQQDYTQGGRYYGDDSRERIYREEYGQGGREYGDVPRGYDAGRGASNRDSGYQGRSREFSGGTGGYDYERGYGDAGRRDFRGDSDRWMDRERHDRHVEQFEDRARDAGSSLRDVGQKISSWFRGDRYMDEGRPNDQGDERSYRTDFGRERRFDLQERGHRGKGPQGYKRSDERISEEVHDRLTEDAWIDASDIHVNVSNGEVTLTGTVDNRETKHRAERLIEDLTGVTHVQNNLRINQGSGLTGTGGRGFGSSALEAEMRRNEQSTDPGNNGASGLSGRTSTGALAERSAGTSTDSPTDKSTKQ